jgi:hypothetical protein
VRFSDDYATVDRTAPDRSIETLTEKKIKSFKYLGEGWHYGTGGPISADTARKALALNAALRISGFSTDAFPGVHDELLVTGYAPDHYVELLVRRDGFFDLLIERKGAVALVRDQIDLSAVNHELARVKQRWSSADSSTPGTMIIEGESSRALPSKNQKAVVLQWSRESVPNVRVDPSASTRVHIIRPVSQASP